MLILLIGYPGVLPEINDTVIVHPYKPFLNVLLTVIMRDLSPFSLVSLVHNASVVIGRL